MNFQQAHGKIQKLQATANQTLLRIVESDGEWQREYSARGGEQMSSLTPEAAEAADRVQADLGKALAKFATEIAPQLIVDHTTRLADVQAKFAAAAQAMTDLATFEREMNATLIELRAPRRPALADEDMALRASAFAASVERLQAPKPEPMPRPSALPRLSFTWLLGR